MRGIFGKTTSDAAAIRGRYRSDHQDHDCEAGQTNLASDMCYFAPYRGASFALLKSHRVSVTNSLAMHSASDRSGSFPFRRGGAMDGTKKRGVHL